MRKQPTLSPRSFSRIESKGEVSAFLYFAYGSNLWPPRIMERCPSARERGAARLEGWRAVYDKPSVDGSSKLNLRPDAVGVVHGALYEISDDHRDSLDLAEPGYQPVFVDVVTVEAAPIRALTYVWTGDAHDLGPYDWYVEMVVRGARHHGLPDDHIRALNVPGVKTRQSM